MKVLICMIFSWKNAKRVTTRCFQIGGSEFSKRRSNWRCSGVNCLGIVIETTTTISPRRREFSKLGKPNPCNTILCPCSVPGGI